MNTYTVFALYADSEPEFQRYATTVQATDPVHAEVVAREEAEGELLIAAVIAGDHVVLDITKTYGDE